MSAQLQVLGLAGLAGSGKSIAAAIIEAEFGYNVVRPGLHISKYMEDEDLEKNPENECFAQIALRKQYGMAALIELSRGDIERNLSRGRNVLIDSMCSYSELNQLGIIPYAVDVRTVAVHAPLAQRREWVRVRPVRPYSYEELGKRDNLEIDCLEKGKTLALADFHLSNETSKERFAESVRTLMLSLVR